MPLCLWPTALNRGYLHEHGWELIYLNNIPVDISEEHDPCNLPKSSNNYLSIVPKEVVWPPEPHILHDGMYILVYSHCCCEFKDVQVFCVQKTALQLFTVLLSIFQLLNSFHPSSVVVAATLSLSRLLS